MGGERVCEVTEWANGEGYDVRIGSSTSAADEQRFDIESADAAALVALLSGMLLGDYQEGVGDE